MKRSVVCKYLCLLAVVLFVVGTFTPTIRAQAEPTESSSAELGNTLEEQLDALDLAALQKYVDSLDGFSGSVTERLLAYIQGETVDYQSFAQSLLNTIFSKISELLPYFACILAIALVSGVLSAVSASCNTVTSSTMLFSAAYAAALLPLLSVLIECFTQTFNTMREIKRQMDIVYPLMLTLMSASGGTLSAAVCKPAVAFFSNGIVSIVTSVIIPLTILTVLFSMANNFSKELKLDKFGDFFKSINKWAIGLCVSVFGLFLTVQGISASTYDGVVKRAAKYAVGNGVPIIGGFLSGGFDLAIAGSVLIKNALGGMGIFLLVAVLFDATVTLIAVTLFLRFTCAVTQPIGDGKISNFLGETADNLRYCTAGLLFTAFLYFLSVVMMISSSAALF